MDNIKSWINIERRHINTHRMNLILISILSGGLNSSFLCMDGRNNYAL